MTDNRKAARVNGELARQLRKAKRLTLRDVARDVQISAPYLCRIEHGEKGASHGVNLGIIQRLAATYGVPADVLIADNDEASMAVTA